MGVVDATCADCNTGPESLVHANRDCTKSAEVWRFAWGSTSLPSFVGV